MIPQKIKLIQADGKIPNLALMKISAYHKQRGDTVAWDTPDPDKVYISCIFSKNAGKVRGIAKMFPCDVDIGGSGVDLKKTLPQEIEEMKPDYDLYPSSFSQGYTTRGCIRSCGFCIVRQKEGKIRPAQHPSTFHDARFETCMIMDNNLLAADQEWQDSVFAWFIKTKTKMISPQGWDIRLITKENAATLRSIKHVWPIHFAWDNVAEEDQIMAGIGILKDAGFDLRHKGLIYVLAGYNTTIQEDLYRVRKLKEAGCTPYLMRYLKSTDLNRIARWVNIPQLFWSMDISEYTRRGIPK